jgi:hypothetical protein
LEDKWFVNNSLETAKINCAKFEFSDIINERKGEKFV